MNTINGTRARWKIRFGEYRRIYIRKVIILGIVIGLFIGAYFLLDEEDFVDEGPWPGIVYRSPGIVIDQGGNLKSSFGKPLVTLAVVACKGRMDEAMTMLKSAIIFSKHVRLHVIAVSDRRSQPKFANKLNELRNSAREIGQEFEYEVYRSWFPKENRRIWRRMFLPCSAQRIFFPSMFPHMDSLMYIDTDVYFASDVRKLWDHFSIMNEKHLAAMAPEHELPGDGWYNLKSQIPYFGLRGLNAGIMLMNLTRMRQLDLEERSAITLNKYYYYIKWADQDILNILFHFYPEQLLEISCEFNFRAQHCYCDYPGGGCACKAAKETGVAIFHGNRKRFHTFYDDSVEFLRDFYKDYQSYNLTTNDPSKLLEALKKSYNHVMQNPCGMSSTEMFDQFETFIKS